MAPEVWPPSQHGQVTAYRQGPGDEVVLDVDDDKGGVAEPGPPPPRCGVPPLCPPVDKIGPRLHRHPAPVWGADRGAGVHRGGTADAFGGEPPLPAVQGSGRIHLQFNLVQLVSNLGRRQLDCSLAAQQKQQHRFSDDRNSVGGHGHTAMYAAYRGTYRADAQSGRSLPRRLQSRETDNVSFLGIPLFCQQI